jgi:Leucine Rich Repeat (LRR) protein
MKTEEFNKLLQEIETRTFVGTALKLNNPGMEEGSKTKGALDDNKTILLANALKKCEYITEVNLTANKIGDIGAIALSEIPTIEVLIISNNEVTIEGATALVKGKFKELDFTANPFLSSNIKKPGEETEFFNALIASNTLTTLDLTYTYFDSKFMANLIANNTSIKKLVLAGCGLTNEVFKLIINNSTLEELELPYNEKITDKGAEYISENIGLKALNLLRTNITDIGAKSLSEHPTLKKLNLIDTQLTIKGANYFIDSNIDKVEIRSKMMTSSESFSFIRKFREAKELKEKLLQKNDYEQIEKNFDNINLHNDIDMTNLSGNLEEDDVN